MPEPLHGAAREAYSHRMYVQWDETSAIVSRVIMISDHSAYLRTSAICASVPTWPKHACNCIYTLFSNQRGRNTLCTEAALNSKGKDTLDI